MMSQDASSAYSQAQILTGAAQGATVVANPNTNLYFHVVVKDMMMVFAMMIAFAVLLLGTDSNDDSCAVVNLKSETCLK